MQAYGFLEINLFNLSSNSAGKQFVDELTKLTDCWVSDSPLSSTALKILVLLLNLLLQKSSNKASNTINKDHFSKRLKIWKEEKVNALSSECVTVQERVETSNSKRKEKKRKPEYTS